MKSPIIYSPEGSYERGEFTATSTIPVNGTYTKQIVLSTSNFKYGIMMLYVLNTVSLIKNRRRPAFIMFTTDINKTIARTGGQNTQSIKTTLATYDAIEHYHKGFKYEDDSILSDYFYHSLDLGVGPFSEVAIKSCVINGSNIDLVFKEQRVTGTTPLNRIDVKGAYHVFI